MVGYPDKTGEAEVFKILKGMLRRTHIFLYPIGPKGRQKKHPTSSPRRTKPPHLA